MANRSSRVLPAILVLTIGFAAGCESTHHEHHDKGRGGFVGGGKPTAPPPSQKPWDIKVGANNPCRLNEVVGNQPAQQQTVGKIAKHTITWHAVGKMYIVLHVPDCENNPFPDAKKISKLQYQDKEGRDLYVIGDGTESKVESGSVDSTNACQSDLNKPDTWIMYDQCVQPPGSTLFQCCDGWIIIDK